MRIVAVDLAAKYSAALHMSHRGGTYNQIDSWGRTEHEWIDAVTRPWKAEGRAEGRAADWGDPPDCLVVEDLPHGVPFMSNTKAVCRLQGRIADRMACYGALDELRFVVPAMWRRHFHLKNGTGPDAVVGVAQANGYTPPDLSRRIARAGDSTIARKVTTDYCAAFLIGAWFLDAFDAADGSLDFPGSSKYAEPSPRARRPRRKPTKINKGVVRAAEEQ